MIPNLLFRWRARPAFRALCLLAAAVIVFNLFYIGAKPVAVGLFTSHWDKVAHFLVFFVMASLIWLGVNGRLPLLVAMTVIAIGGLDELHQSTLPGREADGLDFATDVAAALCSVCVLCWLDRRECRRRSKV